MVFKGRSGFWDLHIHGVSGIDFMAAAEGDMLRACAQLGRRGIGVFAPTLLTDHPDRLMEACARWGDFIASLMAGHLRLPRRSALPLGLHLEGPFLSPHMAGAHKPEFLESPSQRLFDDFNAAAQGTIAIVTLAPELKGALPLIRHMVKQGVRVQLGHSPAPWKDVEKGLQAGASGLTHAFNAMRFHHRDPGLLGALLSHGKCTAELITDGVHVAPPVALWLNSSFLGRIYGVSDGCAAMGSKAGQSLSLGSLKLEKRGPVAYVKGTQILAGGATFLSEHPSLLLRGAPRSARPSAQEISQLFRPPACPALRARLASFHDHS